MIKKLLRKMARKIGIKLLIYSGINKFDLQQCSYFKPTSWQGNMKLTDDDFQSITMWKCKMCNDRNIACEHDFDCPDENGMIEFICGKCGEIHEYKDIT